MGLGLLATLAGLALVDSTSFGTLGVPVVMVVAARRVHLRNMTIYFGTVCLFYFAVGLMLLLGADAIVDRFTIDVDARPFVIAQLVLGIALFLASFRMGNSAKDGAKPKRSWIPTSDSPRAMIGIALMATLLEVATMVPYLSAIGLLTTADASIASKIGVLALYCLVMTVPAVVVIAAASLIGDRLWNRLQRFSAWLERTSAETVGWIVGIVGFFLAADALGRLGLVS